MCSREESCEFYDEVHFLVTITRGSPTPGSLQPILALINPSTALKTTLNGSAVDMT